MALTISVKIAVTDLPSDSSIDRVSPALTKPSSVSSAKLCAMIVCQNSVVFHPGFMSSPLLGLNQPTAGHGHLGQKSPGRMNGGGTYGCRSRGCGTGSFSQSLKNRSTDSWLT